MVTEVGATVIVHGGVGTTVNALAQMMPNVPVAPPVTVTSQAPPAAASVTVMLATTVVALLAVALFTVTPLQPKQLHRLYAGKIYVCQRDRHITGKPCIY